MNQAYKLVWSAASNSWVVASELARGRKKSSGKLLKLALLLAGSLSAGIAAAAPAANALPTGESIASGGATFDRTVTNQLTVNQSSANLITNWSSFDVGSNGKVIFAQPGASSIALNRVSSGTATEIFGQVTANGRLVIVNPNGITFGAGSQVSAASIIGSVMDITDSNLTGGTLLFSRGTSTGTIDNQGTLTATAGSVSLLAPTLKNSGTISASGGNASLINANAVNLTAADPVVSTASSITGLIQQSGSMTATQVSSVGGKIFLTGDTSQSGSKIQLAGTLQGTETNVNGRSIVVNNTLNVNGTSNSLKLTNVDGYSIFGGSVNLNGSAATFSLNGTAYSVIRTLNELQNITSNRAGRYVLANDLNASATSSWNSGAGFNPIGDFGTDFTGRFDGLGHVISGLTINRGSEEDVALFGSTASADIRNLGLTSVNINGGNYTGGIASYMSGGSISNSYVTGTIQGIGIVGGIVGGAENTITLSNVGSMANVTGTGSNVGGIVGETGSTVNISNAFSGGNVSGVSQVGGLVGVSNTITINNSYASGAVSATSGTAAGGLVGAVNGTTTINNSYWNTTTTGRAASYGLLSGGTVNASSAIALTDAQSKLLASYGNWGSNIDAQAGSGSIWRIYNGQSGPLLRSFLKPLTISGDRTVTYGQSLSTINGYSVASGTDASKILGNAIYGGTGAGAINAGTYTQTVSGLYSGNFGYDLSFAAGTLTINKASLLITANQVNKTYDGTTTSNGGVSYIGFAYTDWGTTGGVVTFDSKNAGTGKTVTPSGFVANDGNGGNNYNITYVSDTNSSISKANLTISSSNVSKTYDGSNSAAGAAVLSGGTLYGSDSLSGGTFLFANKNAGTNKIVSVSGVTVNDGNNGDNYNISYANNTSSTINAANLTITTSNVSKNYDGTTSATGAAVAGGGTQLFGSDVLLGGNFAFTNKNAGTGKTVTVAGVTVDDGNGGNNYNVTYANNTTSNIYTAGLIISSSDVTKTYDGTTSAAGNAVVSLGTLFGTDSLSGGTFSFDNKNAGTGKTVTVSGVTVNDDNGGANYSVVYIDNTTSTINKASLVLTSTDVTKTYDGTTSAAGSAVVNTGTLFGTDSLSGGTFAFTNKNAGTGRTVTLSDVTVNDGNSGNNYDVTYLQNNTSTINKAALVISSADVSKTYDGTTSAAGSAVASNGTQLFGSDVLLGGTFAFDNKNAGGGKTVTVADVSVDDGNSGNNYTVSYADNTSSTINKASLGITSSNVTKTYDATTTAAGSAVLSSGTLFGGDSISGGSFAFADKNAGTGKHVSVSGVTVNDGNDGGNYDVTYVDNTASTINKRLLTISAVADSKEYDGKLTSSATAKPVVVGRQRGDAIVGLTQSYADKNAGTGKTINVDSGYTIRDGNGGNNYDVVVVNSNAGVITPKALTISTVANTKVYDGGITSANKPLVTGLVTGDRVTGLFQQYETKTVGTGKKLLIKSGYVVQDGNGGNNYTVTEQGSNDGVITVN